MLSKFRIIAFIVWYRIVYVAPQSTLSLSLARLKLKELLNYRAFSPHQDVSTWVSCDGISIFCKGHT